MFSVPRSSVKVTSIGCFEDVPWRRAIPSLEGLDPLLEGNYKSRKDAIEKCASVAKKRGYKVFAVQDGGMCLSSSTAHKTFDIYGTSRRCTRNGRGGVWANHVYVIGRTKGMFTVLFVYLEFKTMKEGQPAIFFEDNANKNAFSQNVSLNHFSRTRIISRAEVLPKCGRADTYA